MTTHTKHLIEQEEEASCYGKTEEVAKSRKKLKGASDRIKNNEWKHLADEHVTSNDRWEALRNIYKNCKPQRYAKRDIRGNLLNLTDRAESTKAYLEKSHWGKKGGRTEGSHRRKGKQTKTGTRNNT